MAYSFIGFTQKAVQAFDGTVTITRPANTAPGDLMIAHVVGSGNRPSASAGWTLVASLPDGFGPAMAVWTKIMVSGDFDGYDFRILGSDTTRTAVTISTHRGVSQKIDYVKLNQSNQSSSISTGTVPVSKFVSAPILYLGTIGQLSAQVSTSTGTLLYNDGATSDVTGYQQAMYLDSGGNPPVARPGATFAGKFGTSGAAFLGIGVLQLSIPAPPYAPSLVQPEAGTMFDRSVAQRFQWLHSDPNDDAQASYSLRYKITSASSWTVLTDATGNQYRDMPGGMFAAGDYEWQVATTDVAGMVGPYSGSGFFSARQAPASPTITAPASGSTAGPTPVTLSWTANDQDAYQWRRVADASGSPAGGTVYQDSGVIVSAGDRSTEVLFPTNLRTEWIQLRVRKAGLWSTWASTRQVVNYTPPAVPNVALAMDPATASLLVTITDPTPTGNQPPVAYHDVYVDDGDGEERRATGVAASWRHYGPRGKRDYAPNVRVVAVGQTGATSTSVPAA